MRSIIINDYNNVINWSYSLAKKWVIENLVPKGVTSERKFEQYKRQGKDLPKHFPRLPDEYFQRRGSWKGWRDFLGYPEQQTKKLYLSYEDAARISKMNKIHNCQDFRNWEERPSNIPARPDLYYNKWSGWKDFLGNNYQIPKRGTFIKLKESDVRIIKHQLRLGVTGATLAKIFNVSEMQISRIKKGENWSHIN